MRPTRKPIAGLALLLMSTLFAPMLTASDPPRATEHPEARTLTSGNGTYTVQSPTIPAEIPLNEPFSIRARIRIAETDRVPEDAQLAVDGRMPHHRHGMVRTPTLKALGNGEYLIEGMLFHMPGRWELHFDITREGMTERAQCDIELE